MIAKHTRQGDEWKTGFSKASTAATHADSYSHTTQQLRAHTHTPMMQRVWNALILVSEPGGETKESGEPADLPSTSSGEKTRGGGRRGGRGGDEGERRSVGG